MWGSFPHIHTALIEMPRHEQKSGPVRLTCFDEDPEETFQVLLTSLKVDTVFILLLNRSPTAIAKHSICL